MFDDLPESEPDVKVSERQARAAAERAYLARVMPDVLEAKATRAEACGMAEAAAYFRRRAQEQRAFWEGQQ